MFLNLLAERVGRISLLKIRLDSGKDRNHAKLRHMNNQVYTLNINVIQLFCFVFNVPENKMSIYLIGRRSNIFSLQIVQI